MRRLSLIFACALLPLGGATLERLSLDEMIEKSTEIVRGRVVSKQAAFHGQVIYTRNTVQVLERWKGVDAERVDVLVPGGVARGYQQVFSGAPRLVEGEEYVLFLWTGRSGVTHVLGFSQGVFALREEGASGGVAVRSASPETMLDPRTGRMVRDQALQIRLGDLRARVGARTGARQ